MLVVLLDGGTTSCRTIPARRRDATRAMHGVARRRSSGGATSEQSDGPFLGSGGSPQTTSRAQQLRIDARGNLDAGKQPVIASVACELPQEHPIVEDSTPNKVRAKGCWPHMSELVAFHEPADPSEADGSPVSSRSGQRQPSAGLSCGVHGENAIGLIARVRSRSLCEADQRSRYADQGEDAQHGPLPARRPCRARRPSRWMMGTTRAHESNLTVDVTAKARVRRKTPRMGS